MNSLFRFFIVLIAIASFSCEQKQQTAVTTYYLIRHAEKDRSDPTNRNPHLTEAGKERAVDWANFFKSTPLDAVYSTNYHRTLETAAPSATQNGLEILTYDPKNLYDASFKVATAGKQVLIVGHSNTTPSFVNTILGKQTYPSIADDINGNIYIVRVLPDGSSTSHLYHVD